MAISRPMLLPTEPPRKMRVRVGDASNFGQSIAVDHGHLKGLFEFVEQRRRGSAGTATDEAERRGKRLGMLSCYMKGVAVKGRPAGIPRGLKLREPGRKVEWVEGARTHDPASFEQLTHSAGESEDVMEG